MTDSHRPTNNKADPSVPHTQRHIFTYGSLMYEDIFLGVTKCQCVGIPAKLSGWQRYALQNRQYPGAMPVGTEHANIDGVLWLDVPSQAIVALDRFEGLEYKRVAVTVLDADGLQYHGDVYQWLLTEQAAGQWSADTFERHHRETFLAVHGTRHQ